MVLVDAHCHLGSRQFDCDREEVVSRMLDRGVSNAILICCSEHDLAASLPLRNNNPGFRIACSIHPQALELCDTEDRIERLRNAVLTYHTDMIGETGLDYYSHKHTKEVQKMFFRKQMEMAEELGLPVDIHSRRASQDTLDILRNYRVKGIIHSYSGSVEMAQLYIKLGYYISFGSSVLFKGAKKPAEVIAQMPADRLLIETDAPYQSPVPGYRHEPSDVFRIYERIAEIKHMNLTEVADQVRENMDAVFS